MPTIDLQGVTLAYDLTPPFGATAPLVFVHGWLLSRHYWKPVVERLAAHHQCLAYDLRGFGDSTLPAVGLQPRSPRGYSLAAYAEDLHQLLEHLGLSEVWLVGHSLGGSIALWGAAQMSDRVKGVICVNAGGGIYLKEQFEQFRAAGRQIVRLRPKWLKHLPLVDLLFTRAGAVQPLARSWARQRLVDFVTAHPEAALGALLESTTEPEVHRLPQIVAQLEQPTYFITGDRDPIMEPQYVRHLASFHYLFGDGGENVVEIPNCGHLSMLEHPDIVATTIQTIVTNARARGAIANSALS